MTKEARKVVRTERKTAKSRVAKVVKRLMEAKRAARKQNRNLVKTVRNRKLKSK